MSFLKRLFIPLDIAARPCLYDQICFSLPCINIIIIIHHFSHHMCFFKSSVSCSESEYGLVTEDEAKSHG